MITWNFAISNCFPFPVSGESMLVLQSYLFVSCEHMLVILQSYPFLLLLAQKCASMSIESFVSDVSYRILLILCAVGVGRKSNASKNLLVFILVEASTLVKDSRALLVMIQKICFQVLLSRSIIMFKMISIFWLLLLNLSRTLPYLSCHI